MITLKINGKDYSEQDLNILINKDYLFDKTELQMFCDNADVKFDTSHDTINVAIDIVHEEDVESLFGFEESPDYCHRLIERACAIIKKSVENLGDYHRSLANNYVELCRGIIKNANSDTSISEIE